MNRTICIFTAMFCFFIGCNAQKEGTDSIQAHELEEVVVKAQLQHTSATGTTYIPTSRQKNSAQSAMDLLKVMGIPQIRVNPIDEKVTDNFGGDVGIYINYLQASKEEMDGLRTADVRKVEYLEFPTDPRFRGQYKVINIVVREYVYGGYTKLAANENFLLGLSSHVNVFSKFTYKRMTYDLYLGASNRSDSHDGSSTKGIYSLLKDGKPFIVNRIETLEGSKFKQNQYPITFRATYSSDKIQIRNTLGFQHLANPCIYRKGTLDYIPETVGGGDNTFERNNPQRKNSCSYTGSYFFVLPKNFSFDVSPVFNYTHTDDFTEYSARNSTPILRQAREDAYNFRIDGYLRKSIGQKHSLMLGANGGQWSNNLHYTGTNVYNDKFSNGFAACLVGYNFQIPKIAVNCDAGFAWENSYINGQKKDDRYPFAHINLRYSLNNKNMFSAYFQYASNTAGITEKTTDILQENELMYISGNPDLKNSRHMTVNLAYTWLPSNSFGMSAYGRFFGLYDRMFQTYTHYNDGLALLRNWVNDGDYLSGVVGMAFSWKPLNGKLQLYANPEMGFHKITGTCPLDYNPFQLSIRVAYYINQFYFQGLYETPQKSLSLNTNTIYHKSNYYSLTAGWSDLDWNIRLSVYNFLNKGWENSTSEFKTTLYSEASTNYGNNYHPRINISVTYTFGYGKKVQRGNEVGEQSGAASAILK
ncbi:MAG: hypothetical protein OSJ56_01320 [Prevotella sp.]|uniref:hypothetical protein n=1 Tax=Prevotella sp. PTAC TaxID=2736295 RepID=UPI001554656F|nr:hypothetical protein [Prevotella sp. PTAC]MCX4292684.1 hypothetical protein [Prevotella sp.]NPD53211.1 hypothetical protein [Prevotella sp. PTAC]